MESSAPKVAVAVVSWNTRELLARCLEGFRRDFESGTAEVWVVDNGSADGSAEMVRDRFDWAQLIEPGANIGYGPAVNLVAEQTSSEWLAAANADVCPRPRAIDAMLAAGGRDPNVGIVAPRLIQPDGRTQYSIHPFPTLLSTLVFNFGLGSIVGAGDLRATLPAGWDPDRAATPDWAHGALLLIRRSAWDEVGGFDARRWLYAEDLDLSWRLRRAGWRTRYEPTAVVEHAVSASTSTADWGAARDRRAQRAAYAWMLEHVGNAQTRACALLNIAGATARWLGATVATPIRSTEDRARRRLYRHAIGVHLTGLESRGRLLAEREP